MSLCQKLTGVTLTQMLGSFKFNFKFMWHITGKYHQWTIVMSLRLGKSARTFKLIQTSDHNNVCSHLQELSLLNEVYSMNRKSCPKNYQFTNFTILGMVPFSQRNPKYIQFQPSGSLWFYLRIDFDDLIHWNKPNFERSVSFALIIYFFLVF